MELESILKNSKKAAHELVKTDDKKIKKVLMELAKSLEKNSAKILLENKKDLAKISKDDPIYDRVLLDKGRIKGIAESVREIAKYPSPIGKKIESRTLRNGLKLRKVSVPIGVIGTIFEARPNVVVDIFTICFKAKNACVLKGGSDSENSNEILIKIIRDILKKKLGNADFAVLLPNDRAIIGEFLKADKYIDVIIPRGGKGLISFVRDNSKVPVIETGAGVCHTYVDESGDSKMAAKIVFNAKTQRPGVCNSLDTLIVHKSELKDLFLICKSLIEKKVIIYADDLAYKALEKKYPYNLLFKATKESFGTEYLSLKMSIKTVKNFDEAIDHINTYGSGHSESIITKNKKTSERFLNEVDAACVYVNSSTRFTDGGEFGLGAEIGISTQKLHARGPMGIREITSYKWEIQGTGQTR